MILDSGAILYICNDIDRFKSFKALIDNLFILAGTLEVWIEGFGCINLMIIWLDGSKGMIYLKNIIYCLIFVTNIVLYNILYNIGIIWNQWVILICLEYKSGLSICLIDCKADQWLLNYICTT